MAAVKNNSHLDSDISKDNQSAQSTEPPDNNKRRPVRPRFNPGVMLLGFVTPTLVLAAILIAINIWVPLTWLVITLNIALPLIYIILRIKFLAVMAVRIYQKFAPAPIRTTCAFVPCCSDYMIMSIRKYGLLRGLPKGIRRLIRCNGKHSGEDYP